MNNYTIIPALDEGVKEEIRELTESNYGFTPDKYEIERIDKGLRENYEPLHKYRIYNRILTSFIKNIIWQYKDKIGETEFYKIRQSKLIFFYKDLAERCFHEAIHYATICLCRTAIEAGLRERVAEELAKKDTDMTKSIDEKIFEQMNKLKKDTLGPLLTNAGKEKIITKNDVKKMFQKEFGSRSGRNILDKFVHGDIFAIYDFLKNAGKDTTVFSGEEISATEIRKFVATGGSYAIAYEILKITTKIAEILYFK